MSTPVWIVATLWVSRLVLLVLAGLSFWSVAIIIDRRRALGAQRSPGDWEIARSLIDRGAPAADLQAFSKGRASFVARAVSVIAHGGTPSREGAIADGGTPSAEVVDRGFRSFVLDERAQMERGLTVLATLGSNAPFIGLFGTVLGIIQAFGELANSKHGTDAVMSGISEALVATAVGLFVAIPAVVAYNYFLGRVRELITQGESLRDLYLARSLNGRIA